MDIAALSMNMSAARIGSEVSTAVMKLTMDTSKDLANNVMSELLEAVPLPQTGHIDVSV